MRKILGFILILIFLLSVSAATVSALPESSWAMKYVDFCINQGLLLGKNRNTITTTELITRKEVAYAIFKIENPGGNWSNNATSSFTDVASGTSYTGAINWISSVGIMNGTGGGNFSPNNNITKQDLAVAIYRYLFKYSVNASDFKVNNGTLNVAARDEYLQRKYPDDHQSISNYAKNAIYELLLIELITGNDAGQFDLDENISLIEAACMLTKAHGYRYNSPDSINVYVRTYAGASYNNVAVAFLREGSTSSTYTWAEYNYPALRDKKDKEMQIKLTSSGIATLMKNEMRNDITNVKYYANAMSQYTSTFSSTPYEPSAFYKYLTIPQNLSEWELTSSYNRSNLWAHGFTDNGITYPCEEPTWAFSSWCPTALIHSGQNFGWRYAFDDYGNPALVFHKAMDYGCYLDQITNTTPYDMKVVNKGNLGSRGYYIQVSLGNTDKTLIYQHLNAEPTHKIGDTIYPNQVIGITGDSGSPGSFHLHLELKKGSGLDSSNYADYFDPRIYFK